MPSPAIWGLNMVPETPAPEYKPPFGEPFNEIGLVFILVKLLSEFRVTVGLGLTVTIMFDDIDEQVPFETDTLYEPPLKIVTDFVVALLDQVLPFTEDDVKTTEPPWQNVVDPTAVIVGVAGFGLIVTTFGADDELQLPLIAVTL